MTSISAGQPTLRPFPNNMHVNTTAAQETAIAAGHGGVFLFAAGPATDVDLNDGGGDIRISVQAGAETHPLYLYVPSEYAVLTTGGTGSFLPWVTWWAP